MKEKVDYEILKDITQCTYYWQLKNIVSLFVYDDAKYIQSIVAMDYLKFG